jgi:sulfatase modifying factor 1
MVYIPGGPFLMGSKPTDGVVGMEIGIDELPQHRVTLPGFFIDRYEVTVGDYRKFVEATGHRPPRVWTNSQYAAPSDDHPVIDVNWSDADAYCRWTGKRLPAEAEWEKAARGTDGRLWPWGNQWIAGAANIQGDRRWTAPVGSYPLDKSPYGVFDMAGNAMEWTSSWYQAYPGSTLQRAAFGEQYKILKGGSWMTPVSPFTHAANRYGIAPKWDHPHFGFRCARDEEGKG